MVWGFGLALRERESERERERERETQREREREKKRNPLTFKTPKPNDLNPQNPNPNTHSTLETPQDLAAPKPLCPEGTHNTGLWHLRRPTGRFRSQRRRQSLVWLYGGVYENTRTPNFDPQIVGLAYNKRAPTRWFVLGTGRFQEVSDIAGGEGAGKVGAGGRGAGFLSACFELEGNS